MTKIATILRSSSHLTYIAQIINPREELSPPDFALGNFVSIEPNLIALIYDTELSNPLALSYTQQKEEQAVYVPDLKDETNILIKLALLGQLNGEGYGDQKIPSAVLDAGIAVSRIQDFQLRQFHFTDRSKFQLEYLSHLKEAIGGINLTLLGSIKAQLKTTIDHHSLRLLELVERDLRWQSFTGV